MNSFRFRVERSHCQCCWIIVSGWKLQAGDQNALRCDQYRLPIQNYDFVELMQNWPVYLAKEQDRIGVFITDNEFIIRWWFELKAIPQFFHHLRSCLSLTTVPSWIDNTISFELFSWTGELLNEKNISLWKLWSDQFALRLQKKLKQNDADFNSFLIEFLNWDEQVNGVEPIIRVPSKPSFPHQRFMQKTCILLNEIVQHTLPIVIAASLVQKVAEMFAVEFILPIRTLHCKITLILNLSITCWFQKITRRCRTTTKGWFRSLSTSLTYLNLTISIRTWIKMSRSLVNRRSTIWLSYCSTWLNN